MCVRAARVRLIFIEPFSAQAAAVYAFYYYFYRWTLYT